MKLELKHIAPYLPYKLKCNIMGEVENEKGIIFELSGITNELNLEVNCHVINAEYYYQPPIYEVFPILRPLSDLKRSTWLNKLYIEFGGGYNSLASYRKDNLDNILYSAINSLPYGIVSKLIELHFDVFRLIEEKLAINYRDLIF